MLTKPVRKNYPYQYHHSTRRPRRVVKYAKQALIALLAFLTAANLLNQIIPSPTIPANVDFISPKYTHYQQHRDDYNALFFGSSRIYSHITPEVFDKSLNNALDTPDVDPDIQNIKSFNFGIPGLRAIPGYVLMRDVLKTPPKNLKWVFIETPLDKGYEGILNARTTRSIYWHTPANTGIALQYILGSHESILNKSVLIGSHLLPFFYHQINIGRVFNQWLPINQFSAVDQDINKSVLEKEGYYPLVGEDDPNRQQFLAHLNRYEQSVEQLGITTDPAHVSRTYLSSGQLNLIQKLVELVEAAGAHPIFIVPPTLEPQLELKRAHQLGYIPTLWSFNNPKQYPELYALEQRYDEEHLNPKGARLFTKMIAETFNRNNLLSPSS